MHRFTSAACSRIGTFLAAVASVVVTVVATLGTVLGVHADQTEWAPTRVGTAPDAADEPAEGNGDGFMRA